MGATMKLTCSATVAGVKPLETTLPDNFAVVCAWCKDSKSKTAKLVSEGWTVSHTICPACKEKFMATIPAAVGKLDEP